MAMRKHLSGVFRLSNAFSNIGCEKATIPSIALVQRKTYQKENHISSSFYKSQIPSIRICHGFITVKTDLLQTSENKSVSNEYHCPSRLSQKLSQMVIVDKQTNKSDYHLPLANSVITSIVDPHHQNEMSEINDPASQHTQKKEAKEIMKIRHKKMKKHKLKKLRKRMYFLWRRQKMTRKAKRAVIYWKEIEDIKKEGNDFDAETFVKDQLEKARRGGYHINVFNSRA